MSLSKYVCSIILDESGNLASIFIHGQISLGGGQVFSGYQGRDDFTTAAFIHHAKYGELYKTGDMRFVNDVIFCGRRDTQVKLHGHGLEPKEISCIIDEITSTEGNVFAVIEG
jgi:non-ribosomal peptide synthetase component F